MLFVFFLVWSKFVSFLSVFQDLILCVRCLCVSVCVYGLFGEWYTAVAEQKSMLWGSAGTLLSFCLTACVCFFCSFSKEPHLPDRDTAFSSILAHWLSLWPCPLKHGCYEMHSTHERFTCVCVCVCRSVCVIHSIAELAGFPSTMTFTCQRSTEHQWHEKCEKMTWNTEYLTCLLFCTTAALCNMTCGFWDIYLCIGTPSTTKCYLYCPWAFSVFSVLNFS